MLSEMSSDQVMARSWQSHGYVMYKSSKKQDLIIDMSLLSNGCIIGNVEDLKSLHPLSFGSVLRSARDPQKGELFLSSEQRVFSAIRMVADLSVV